MSKTPFLIATAFALCATTLFADHAAARERSRAVQRSGSISGANGGSAGYDRSAYRNADGSAGRQGSAYANGPNGGTASTSGGISRDADGHVSGARNTTATGANGNSYTGSTTVSDGTLVHTRSCTNTAGDAIACPRGN